MPIQSCTSNGKSGTRYGESGKCYTGPGAKKKAVRQAVAIQYSQKRAGKTPDPISHEKAAEVKKYIKMKLRGEEPIKDLPRRD